MEPPQESPIIFDIEFLGNYIQDLIELPGQTEDEFRRFRYDLYRLNLDGKNLEELDRVMYLYRYFLSSIVRPAIPFGGHVENRLKEFLYGDDPLRDLISEEDLERKLDEINAKAREGDIIVLEYRRFYYVSGFGNNRKLHQLLRSNEPRYFLQYILPPEALVGLKSYKMSQLKDIEKYYPNLDITAIEIPGKFLVPKQRDPEIFHFANKDTGIALNIGDNQVIYVSKN